MLNALYDMLEESNRNQTKIQSDAGTAFINKHIKVVLQEYIDIRRCVTLFS